MAYQQRLMNRPFAVIELFAERTTLERIHPLLSELRGCVDSAALGMYYAIGGDQERVDAAMQRQTGQPPRKP